LIANISINPPLFFSLFYLWAIALAALVDYPNQKYVLWRKLPNGQIRKVATLTEPITWEQAVSRYGYAPYMLQSMKPRTKVIWNHLSASSKEANENNEVHNIDLQPLEQKTDYLGYGLLGSFGTQALGFGLSHLRFSQIEDRIATIETALRSLPVQGLACTLCFTPILTMLQEACTGCGSPIEWPKNSPTKNSTSRKWSLP